MDRRLSSVKAGPARFRRRDDKAYERLLRRPPEGPSVARVTRACHHLLQRLQSRATRHSRRPQPHTGPLTRGRALCAAPTPRTPLRARPDAGGGYEVGPERSLGQPKPRARQLAAAASQPRRMYRCCRLGASVRQQTGRQALRRPSLISTAARQRRVCSASVQPGRQAACSVPGVPFVAFSPDAASLCPVTRASCTLDTLQCLPASAPFKAQPSLVFPSQ